MSRKFLNMFSLVICALFFVYDVGSAALIRDRNDGHHDEQVVVGPVASPSAADGPVRAMEGATPTWGTQLSKPTGAKAWKVVECDSRKDDAHDCKHAINDDDKTWWQSNEKKSPHYITIDLGEEYIVTALRMKPHKDWDSLGGSIAGHRVSLSNKEKDWTRPVVAYGTWVDDGSDKWAIFEPETARYVRLEATTATRGKPFVIAQEFDIWVAQSVTVLPPDGSLGRWGPTIDFPIVPVGVFLDPHQGHLVSFSSETHDGFPGKNSMSGGSTFTATWFPASQTVTELYVANTKHGMFCPGMAYDVTGRMIITGGQSSFMTTSYDKGTWTRLKQMTYPRGYQGSVTSADGRIFVVGGSWGVDQHQRLPNLPCDIYDPSTDKWEPLLDCNSSAIRTKTDGYPDYRADNHVWLVGWKQNSIFHAGPAAEMHWIDTSKGGAMTPGGQRGKDGAMCGTAVMYDAEAGEILAAGGAAQYEYYKRGGTDTELFVAPEQCLPDPEKKCKAAYGKDATGEAFIIKLPNDVGQLATVTPTGNLNHPRTFHNAVVLPNGEVFVVGGMTKGEPFKDETAQLVPEMWSPIRKVWRPMAPNSIPRTYHSVALLLPDATVLVGGGGLSDHKPAVNHLDAQIYTPPYLLTGRKRPTISKVSASESKVMLGADLSFTVDGEIVGASLIRYGGATHTVNNDQRRVKLVPIREVGTAGEFRYRVAIPKEPGVAIPGFWMLFVLDNFGVPSVAYTVQVLCPGCKQKG
ncbi:hypothetical protein B0T25DRAFT_537123 [Lasiosphaeria hispida]|uniref:F5/8 type C domain-containing protein n=1 Tax=Lasiosphaeria hispida TaxID=260671 RepID=A0AAJ0HKM0_9PEZI|nr:hypothetical protein B0T25DRAFT_537123 [Lasiosphaeria hispida]